VCVCGWLGCYCPAGLFLQDGRCVDVSECECLWEGSLIQPGQEVRTSVCSSWSGDTHAFQHFFWLYETLDHKTSHMLHGCNTLYGSKWTIFL